MIFNYDDETDEDSNEITRFGINEFSIRLFRAEKKRKIFAVERKEIN